MEAGLHPAASELLLKSFDLFEQLKDGIAQAECLQNLATNQLALGDHAAATRSAESGLRLARVSGNRRREGHLLIELGKIRAATGDQAAALDTWRQAAAILHAGFPNDEAAALELLAGQSSDRPT